MASETSELTFVRCPSCRSLVPATASRCRICNNPLEGADGQAKAGDADPSRAASRVRQKTMSATPEDIALALNQGNNSIDARAASQQPPPPVQPAKPQQDAADDTDFDPLSAYLEELEEEPAALVVAEQGDDAPFVAEAASPETPSAGTAELDDDFGFDIFDDFEPDVEVAPGTGQSAPLPANSVPVTPVQSAPVHKSAPAAAPLTAQPERREEQRRDEPRRESPRPPPASQQPVKREQNARVQNNDRHADRQPRDVAQQSKREGRDQSQSQQPQRHNHQHNQHQSKGQQVQQGGDRARDDRRVQQDNPRPAERKHEERRRDERRGDERRSDERRNDDRRSQATPPPPPVADGVQVASVGPKTGKMRPGRLFGWFVSYENPDGRAIELREGKFFVTGSSIRPTDLILEDPSISTPHALMAVSAEGGLVIQDLMSDRGVFVRSSGGGGYRREEGTVHVAHGDWVRFGDVEFLVIIVPNGSTR
jgi:hypothetical protein